MDVRLNWFAIRIMANGWYEEIDEGICRDPPNNYNSAPRKIILFHTPGQPLIHT